MPYKKLILCLAVFSLLFSFNLLQAKAQTAQEIQAKIDELLSQIGALQLQLKNLQPQTETWCHTFTTNLKIGDTGTEVKSLQKALGLQGVYQGELTGVFDETTASAVSAFQEKYSVDILSSYDLTRGTGYFGKGTRAKMNLLYGCKTIPPSRSITVLWPRGGDIWLWGGTYNIIWDAYGFNTVNIDLINETTGSSTPIATNISAASSTYAWTIPTSISPGDQYKISVGDSTLKDKSDGYFSIVTSTTSSTTPSITVLSPNGGERWEVGKTHNITWVATGTPTVSIYLATTASATSTMESSTIPIAENISATSSPYAWTIPYSIIPGQYIVSIGRIGTTIKDESDNYFSIILSKIIEPPVPTTFEDIKNQLASIAIAISQLIEYLKSIQR